MITISIYGAIKISLILFKVTSVSSSVLSILYSVFALVSIEKEKSGIFPSLRSTTP